MATSSSKRVRWTIAVGCLLFALGGSLIATRRRPPPAGPIPGDVDGDGRYQRARWSAPDAEGVPTTFELFAGGGGEYDSVEVQVAVPGQGLIGSFASSAPDMLDSLFDLEGEPDAVITWDLSTYPAGQEFTVVTKYRLDDGTVIDSETITTTRPTR